MVKKQVEEVSELQIPAFYRSGDEVVGIFSEDTVISCYIGKMFSSINVKTIESAGPDLPKIVSNWTEISEQHFRSHYESTLKQIEPPKQEVTTAHLNERFSNAV